MQDTFAGLKLNHLSLFHRDHQQAARKIFSSTQKMSIILMLGGEESGREPFLLLIFLGRSIEPPLAWNHYMIIKVNAT